MYGLRKAGQVELGLDMLEFLDTPQERQRFLTDYEKRLAEASPESKALPVVDQFHRSDIHARPARWTWTFATPMRADLRNRPDDEVKITASIDDRFSDAQRKIITDAFVRISKNLPPAPEDGWGVDHKTDSRDRNLPFYDTRLWQALEDCDCTAMNVAMYLGFLRHPSSPNKPEAERNKINPIFIDRFDEQPDANGRWNLGLGEVNLYHNMRVLGIKLNGTALGPGSTYQRSQDVADWADTIIHECLHNFGWRHTEDSQRAWMVRYSRAVAGLAPNSLNLDGDLK